MDWRNILVGLVATAALGVVVAIILFGAAPGR